MLRTRILTAIVLIPVAAGLILLGGLPFLLSIAVLLTAAEIEFSSLVGHRGFRLVHLAGVSVVWLCLGQAGFPDWSLVEVGWAAVVLLSLSFQALRYPRAAVGEWTATMAGGLYIGICGAYLIKLRAVSGSGTWWTLIAVSVILVADSAAYVIGSTWGHRQLAPQLSPDKTVEGYLGGVAAGALLGGLLGHIWSMEAAVSLGVTGVRGLVLGILIAALAPMGDLVVSMLKRDTGVKDSGNLFPGHGGALDRLDSVLFASVIAYLYITRLLR